MALTKKITRKFSFEDYLGKYEAAAKAAVAQFEKAAGDLEIQANLLNSNSEDAETASRELLEIAHRGYAAAEAANAKAAKIRSLID